MSRLESYDIKKRKIKDRKILDIGNKLLSKPIKIIFYLDFQ